MTLPVAGEPPWGFVEWTLTGLSTLSASAAAFVWRLMARIERMSSAIDHQRVDFDGERLANQAALIRLSETLAQAHDDHYRLRETIGALPTRADLRDVEDRIGERIAALAARFDRALEKRGS
jgi:hypothetical protein